jgi:hypothetical protein
MAIYEPKVVHYDSSQSLYCPHLVAPQSNVGFISWWQFVEKTSTDSVFNPIQMDSFVFGAGISSVNSKFPAQLRIFIGTSDPIAILDQTFIGLQDTDSWNHFLIAWNTQGGSSADLPILALYKNDALISNYRTADSNIPSWDGFELTSSQGDMASLNGDGCTMIAGYVDVAHGSIREYGDLCDVFFSVGENIIQPDGTIGEADRRNFITSIFKPVDPAIAVSTYGQPIIMFSGDASAQGFQRNQGSGGVFVLTGAFTNSIINGPTVEPEAYFISSDGVCYVSTNGPLMPSDQRVPFPTDAAQALMDASPTDSLPLAGMQDTLWLAALANPSYGPRT